MDSGVEVYSAAESDALLTPQLGAKLNLNPAQLAHFESPSNGRVIVDLNTSRIFSLSKGGDLAPLFTPTVQQQLILPTFSGTESIQITFDPRILDHSPGQPEISSRRSAAIAYGTLIAMAGFTTVGALLSRDSTKSGPAAVVPSDPAPKVGEPEPASTPSPVVVPASPSSPETKNDASRSPVPVDGPSSTLTEPSSTPLRNDAHGIVPWRPDQPAPFDWTWMLTPPTELPLSPKKETPAETLPEKSPDSAPKSARPSAPDSGIPTPCEKAQSTLGIPIDRSLNSLFGVEDTATASVSREVTFPSINLPGWANDLLLGSESVVMGPVPQESNLSTPAVALADWASTLVAPAPANGIASSTALDASNPLLPTKDSDPLGPFPDNKRVPFKTAINATPLSKPRRRRVVG